MRIINLFRFVLVLFLLVLLPGCQRACQTVQTSSLSVPPEILEQSYLFEVVRHLYRWLMDESEVERIVGAKRFVFWIRRLEPTLDPCDRSIICEIRSPRLDISVKVKKADYTSEELGAVVKSSSFKITQISRGYVPAKRPLSCELVDVDMNQMRDYLFRTRNQLDYPDFVMMERLRKAVRRQIAKEGIDVNGIPAGDRIVHLASLSPVANEIWVFWEDGHKLFYFASDIDIADPAVWRHEELMVRIFDLDKQVILSHEEAPGSNRFLTRYQVSRALFNCIVLGRRITMPPVAQSDDK
jgi:hypothetical protein